MNTYEQCTKLPAYNDIDMFCATIDFVFLKHNDHP